MKKLYSIFALSVLLAGCTHFGKRADSLQGRQSKTEALIAEQSRTLTTGQVDALSLAPTNPPTNLALKLAKANQRIQGLPLEPIDVPAVLAGDPEAEKQLKERLAENENLLNQKALLESKLRETEAALIEKGKLYEAEKSKRVVRRVWEWATATFGLGGIIALLVCFPALIPVLGSIVGWIVGKLPRLVSFIGLVPKKAFDAVVKGVGQYREIKKQTEKKPVIDEILATNTNPHEKIIESRRKVLGV